MDDRRVLNRNRGLSDADADMLGRLVFLRDLRVELHIQAGRGSDELTREEQVRIAEERGFYAAAGMLGVEHFMQVYFGYTREVAQVTRGLTHRPRGAQTTKLRLGYLAIGSMVALWWGRCCCYRAKFV